VVDLLLESAQQHGVPAGPAEAQMFQEMVSARLSRFHEVNLTRDPQQGSRFWTEICADWLRRLQADPALAPAIQERVDRLAFGRPSAMFALYDDVLPCLELLRGRGIKMAVISNWDYSLHRVLKLMGIDFAFDHALASLEEGMEKPDPRLFHIALQQLGALPEETLHVGDDPVDDIEGAANAGIAAVLIDRSGANANAIRSLDELII
jgi:putative hydrolase of the HAD superfamily